MVEHGDTAVGPVGGLYPAVANAVDLAVDHDHATRIYPLLVGRLDVVQIGVVDVDRLVIAGVGLLVVEDVATFRGALIPFPLLVTLGRRAQRDPVAFDLFAILHQGQAIGGLLDHHHVGRQGGKTQCGPQPQ